MEDKSFERYLYHDRVGMLLLHVAYSTRYLHVEPGHAPITIAAVMKAQKCSRTTARRLLERMTSDKLLVKSWRASFTRYEYHLIGDAREECEHMRHTLAEAVLAKQLKLQV